MFKALAANTPEGDDLDTETPSGASTPAQRSPAKPSVSSPPTTSSATASVATPSHAETDQATLHDEPRGSFDAAAEDSGSQAVKAWLETTTTPLNDANAERFTAATMSSFSPYATQELLNSTQEVAGNKLPSRPPLPAVTEEKRGFTESPASSIFEAGSRTDGDSASASGYASSEVPPTPEDLENARFSRTDIPESEKLAVIQQEFGDIASNMLNEDGTPGAPEHLLAECQGALFKGVMMIGNLHLTTHRLVFHALQPPDSMYVKPDATPLQTEAATAAREARPDILQAGSVTLHRGGLIKNKRRVWMELTPDMLTTYPSADEAGRVRPLVTVLLSSVLRLNPQDEQKPCDFFLAYESSNGIRTTHFTVDNQQSALHWRRTMEGALFRYARQRFRESHVKPVNAKEGHDTPIEESEWTMLRCCVPLDRATIEGISEYHSFATLANLQVSLDDNNTVTWHPEQLSKGNYRGYGLLSDYPGELDSAESSPPGTPSRTTTSASDESKRHRLTLKTPFKLPGSRPSSRDSSRDRVSGHRRADSLPTSPIDSLKGAERQIEKDLKLLGHDGPSPHFPPQRSLTANSRWSHPAANSATPPPHANSFQFLVAVLNEQAWFATAVEAAVKAAHRRHYKPDAKPAKMTIDIGGYDCLATDEDAERHDDTVGDASSAEIDPDDDEDATRPRMVIEARKAEKAAMAAKVFGLREDEGIWLKRCYVQHGLVPGRGHIIVTPRYVCFWRRATVGSDIKYRFATRDVKGAVKSGSIRPGMYGMALQIHGRHDLRFDFWHESGRDEAISRINTVAAAQPQRSGSTDSPVPAAESDTASAMDALRDQVLANDQLSINPTLIKEGKGNTLKAAAEVLAPPKDMLFTPKAMSEVALSFMPFVANRPWQVGQGAAVRLTPRRFTMLTIGSRGDVQPYIALGLRLMKDGHKCVIITHDEFKDWIEGYGIEHRAAGGDPTALMKLSTAHRMFSPAFFKEALGTFRQWLDDLLVDAWKASHDADVLIESPSAMAGIHIAEALKIPYFRAFTMPWTRTMAYPQAFMVPAFDMGPSFNYSTYVLFDNIMWRASSGQINRWRKKHLHLKPTDQSSLSVSKVPFLYNFSPSVVPKPLDWYDDITITGYWNLENSDMDWTPPDSLVAFMDKAKADGKPIVYIGFGSIVVPDPTAVTKSIIKGVGKADVRAIIAKGWSARDADKEKNQEEVEYPENCYPLDKVPHGWLFPKIQAALHHGGAGTVGASLRAGIPTLIKPWFGDQHFWALRVTKLDVGMKVASLHSSDIADALKKATTNTVMIEKAARIGERIRSESGVDAAVQTIHYQIIRAARDRNKKNKMEAVVDTMSHEALAAGEHHADPMRTAFDETSACRNAISRLAPAAM
ncbi:hypothetical protein Q8F55_001333 [Vanrija albida]|uniref:PH domain-containing protein n=1 Tax=Vanrija albida TaxID=181172 RepID=A0ABR3QFT6_9TREE